jgi:hypothetical protein
MKMKMKMKMKMTHAMRIGFAIRRFGSLTSGRR